MGEWQVSLTTYCSLKGKWLSLPEELSMPKTAYPVVLHTEHCPVWINDLF